MMTTKQRLTRQFPQLTESDFSNHETDLYVVAYPFVKEWLTKEYEWPQNVQYFIGNPQAEWNGAGRECADVPFAAWDMG